MAELDITATAASILREAEDLAGAAVTSITVLVEVARLAAEVDEHYAGARERCVARGTPPLEAAAADPSIWTAEHETVFRQEMRASFALEERASERVARMIRAAVAEGRPS